MTDGEQDVSAPSADIELAAEEQELITFDLDAVLPTLQGQQQQRFADLRDAVATGVVPAELSGALESVLELTLQTGRARTRYRADGEQTLTGLYRKTPAGQQLAAHLRSVNEALRSLQGEVIESFQVRMRTVGHFTLALQTDQTSITLAARPDVIDVESITVGS